MDNLDLRAANAAKPDVRRGRALSSDENLASIPQAAAATGRPGVGTTWPVALCYSGMVTIAIATNLAPVYLTTFSRVFGGAAGLSDQQLGMIGTLIFVGIVAGLLVSGPLADRFGARAFVLIGSGLIGAGLGAMAIASNYGVLLLAAGLMGFGAGVLDMILSPIIAALRPDNRTSAMNWLHAFYSIGAVMVTLLAALMIRLSVHSGLFGWRNVCLVLILVPVAVLVGFTRAPVPALVAKDKERTSSRTLLRHPAFWIAMLTMTLAGASELGMAQWLPAYAEKGLGYPKWAGGLALTGFCVVMAFGRLVGGVISRHVRPISLLITCCVVTAFLYLGGALLPIRPIALASCALVGLTVELHVADYAGSDG